MESGQKPTEELWEIHGRSYDLSRFAGVHPGGKRMLWLGRGRDNTALFESTHLFDELPKAMLKRFPSTPVATPRSKFSWEESGFYATVKKRVANHFREEASRLGVKNFEKRIARGTGWFHFRLLALLGLSAWLGYHAVFQGSLIHAIAWGPIAFFLGGYGHEALHGAVFPGQLLNRITAILAMDVHGISSYVYSHVHITEHHISPNVERVDPDIVIHYPLLREFQYQERKWFHRFQSIYFWPVYGVSLFFANVFDFLAVATGRWGNISCPRPYPTEMLIFCATKAFMITYLFVMPLYHWGPGHGLLIILAMLIPGSLLINLNFALNHQNHEAMQLLPGGKSLTQESFRDWGELQVRTACDYQHGHWFTDMLFSGLNYQIEHHLFPLVSYSRLPMIAPIVRKTCAEFGIPYHYYPSYGAAILAHVRFLRKMGRPIAAKAPLPAV